MQVKPLAGLTRKLRVVFLIYLGIVVLGVAASLSMVAEYSRLAPGAEVYDMRASDRFVLVSGSLGSLAALTVVIVFLVWLYRASRNLRLLSGRYMRFTPGWAVGWWFIPFANLVMPYKVVREIWQVGHGAQPARHGLVKWWWGLYLVVGFVSRISWRVGWEATTPGTYVTSGVVDAISGLMTVAAAAVTILMIARIGAAYERTVVEPVGTLALSAAGTVGSEIVYGPPPGWYADPWGRHDLRFWDAMRWSPYVIDEGVQALDPV